MYDKVYEAMVDCSIALKLDDLTWFNKDGKRVDMEEEAYGRNTKYMLTHPEKVFLLMNAETTPHKKIKETWADKTFL